MKVDTILKVAECGVGPGAASRKIGMAVPPVNVLYHTPVINELGWVEHPRKKRNGAHP